MHRQPRRRLPGHASPEAATVHTEPIGPQASDTLLKQTHFSLLLNYSQISTTVELCLDRL